MRRLILLGSLMALLLGCTTPPKEIVITQTVTRYVGMDDAWLQNCPTPLPPTQKEEYSAADYPSRVDMWSEWYLLQIGQTGKRNQSLDAAREYNTRKKQETTTVSCTAGVCK